MKTVTPRFLLATVFLMAAHSRADAFIVPPSPAVTVEELIEWLPANTETIAVTRGPMNVKTVLERAKADSEARMSQISRAIEGKAEPAAKPKRDLSRFTAMLEALALGQLTVAGDGKVEKHLATETVALVVEGSRHFRSPRALGLMPYEGCHIVVFQRDLGKAGESVMKSLKADADRVEDVDGHQVLVFERKAECDTWSFHVVRPRPEFLICATDRGYLEEVLIRMRKKPPTRALPANLPEWKHVDTKARFWAIRHYDKANAATDPTTPLTTEKRAANHPDLQAIGLVFMFDPDRDPVAKVRYLSANKDALRIASQGWIYPSERVETKLRKMDDGVIEVTVNLSDRKGVHLFLLVLLASLGHGVYL